MIFLFPSCEKIIIEAFPVVEVIEDLSIPNAGNIWTLQFSSELIGYAVAETKIYKTINGGKHWEELIETPDEIDSLEFFDDENGMYLSDEKVYITHNGGETWNLKYPKMDFIGQTEDGKGIVGYCHSYCRVRISHNKGETFSFYKEIPINFDFEFAKISDNKLIVFGSSFFRQSGIDFDTNSVIDYGELPGIPNDIYFNDSLEYSSIMVANTGFIAINGKKINRINSYSYYGVDGYDGLFLLVGHRTITTNLPFGKEDEWNDAVNSDGNGFPNTFLSVQFINHNTFYLTATDGVILKAKI